MGLFTTYSENVQVKYKSTVCSSATFFNALIITLSVIGPYLIGYRMQGFWTRLEICREQPIVQFKYEVLVILEGKDTDGKFKNLVWSTFPGLNSMLKTKVNPFVMSREGDHNLDAVHEYLDFELSIPLPNKEEIHGAHIILLFDYKLYKYAALQMETMIFSSYSAGRGGNKYEFIGDMSLVQKQPLWSRIRDTRFNYPIVSRNSTNIKDYTLSKIITDYASRNVSTMLKNKYDIWQIDGSIKDEFMIKARILYSEDSYEIYPGFWQTLKWAWVQYLAIFFVIFPTLRLLQHVVYKARLFETMLYVPWEKPSITKPMLK